MEFLDSYLTASGAIVDIRMVGVHKVGGVLAYHTAAGLKN